MMRIAIKLLLISLLLPLTLLLPGCDSSMHDPWIVSPDELKQERMRNADQEKALRERIAQVQTDR